MKHLRKELTLSRFSVPPARQQNERMLRCGGQVLQKGHIGCYFGDLFTFSPPSPCPVAACQRINAPDAITSSPRYPATVFQRLPALGLVLRESPGPNMGSGVCGWLWAWPLPVRPRHHLHTPALSVCTAQRKLCRGNPPCGAPILLTLRNSGTKM